MSDEQQQVEQDGRVHTEQPAEGSTNPGQPQDERAHAEDPAEGA